MLATACLGGSVARAGMLRAVQPVAGAMARRRPNWGTSVRNGSTVATENEDVGPPAESAPGYKKIMFLGPPGSGKGSYSKPLAKMLGIAHLSPGEVLRTELRRETALGKAAAEYTRRGDLVPAEIIVKVMAGIMGSCENGFILDGFPRNWEQAKMLDAVTDIDLVVHTVMREDVLKTKLLGRRVCPDCGVAYNVADVNLDGGRFVMPPLLPTNDSCIKARCVDRLEQREDDTVAAIERRLQVYTDETELLLEHYRARTEVKDIHIQGGYDLMMPVFRRALGIDKQ